MACVLQGFIAEKRCFYCLCISVSRAYCSKKAPRLYLNIFIGYWLDAASQPPMNDDVILVALHIFQDFYQLEEFANWIYSAVKIVLFSLGINFKCNYIFNVWAFNFVLLFRLCCVATSNTGHNCCELFLFSRNSDSSESS